MAFLHCRATRIYNQEIGATYPMSKTHLQFKRYVELNVFTANTQIYVGSPIIRTSIIFISYTYSIYIMTGSITSGKVVQVVPEYF